MCHTTDPKRAESDAEHTWHLALFLVLLEKELKGIDLARTLKIALIHDLPEIHAGDTNPYRGNTDGKEENEKKAADRLFSSLPVYIRDEFTVLFEEYQQQETVEAKIVKSADKLMPLIQNLCTNDTFSSYRKLDVKYPEVRDYMDPYFSSKGILKDLYLKLVTESNDKGVFGRDEPNRPNGEIK